ncbi:hypothetical protein B0H11DRAFT_1921222 [Mycena galericulata]|nr:hypothetical protein B0H11DRAFT_1921222 [Mycena galericulata]
MPPPALLFSSYRVEISVDLNLRQNHIPGIGIPGKVVVAQITDKLVVLMVGFLGHEKPFLSLVDWCAVPSDVQAVRTSNSKYQSVFDPIQTSRSVVLHFADIHPVGTLAHLTGGADHCSLGVRVALEDQAAFWAFAYLLVKPLAHATDIATDIRANSHLLSEMHDYFKADIGPEYFEGAALLDPTIEANPAIQNSQTIDDEGLPAYTG